MKVFSKSVRGPTDFRLKPVPFLRKVGALLGRWCLLESKVAIAVASFFMLGDPRSVRL